MQDANYVCILFCYADKLKLLIGFSRAIVQKVCLQIARLAKMSPSLKFFMYFLFALCCDTMKIIRLFISRGGCKNERLYFLWHHSRGDTCVQSF
jgi:hypothetical protein